MNSFLILLPFLGVVVLNLPFFKAFMRKIAFGCCALILVTQALSVVYPQACTFSNNFNIFGSFLEFNFTIDGLSNVMLFCIAVVLFVALIVEDYIIRDKERFFNFANMLLLLLAGMNGVVMVRDIFSLYVFIEITAICSFVLIGFNKDVYGFEGAFKYIILSVAASVLMLSAIALLLMSVGDTGFLPLKAALKGSPDHVFLSFAIGLFLCACFIKSGLMPFHGWLPDTYSRAPAAVGILLAGIVTKTVGVYALIRIAGVVFYFDNSIKYILLMVGILSVVAAALAALGQHDFRRMLAYSSISQVGYIILGLASGTALGVTGAVLHLFNHAMFKSLLFVNATAVELETGTNDMTKLSGLAEKMPFTGITSVLASLSCAGVPPLSGFWSKLMIIAALWISGAHGYAIAAALASILTLAYFLILQRRVFFGRLSGDFPDLKEAGFGLVFAETMLAAIIVVTGLAFPFVAGDFISLLSNILGG